MTATATSPRVLVADDQPDVVLALRLLLKDAGIVSEPAVSMRDVVAKVEARPYDLLLMDLNYARDTTSGQEGLELLSRVRAHDDLLPVVVMTGWSSVETAVEAMRLGARNYICKPWNNDSLVSLVRHEIEVGSALRKDHDRAAREVEQARSTQRELLPERLPEFESCDLAARWEPASSFGGDCYDVMPLDHSHFALSIGDVCGKGLPAAILMSHLMASVRALASPLTTPESVVAAVNRTLCRHGDRQRFVTLFYAVYDTASRGLRFCNAGHNWPVLLRHNGVIERLTTGGTIAGVFEEALYEAGQIQLEAGDRLVLFTDGITEARSPDGAEFGEDRLMAILHRAGGLEPATTLDHLFGEVRAFCESGLQDDATAVVLHVA